jgi:UDP-N-acetylglucosamine 3-dehydrogenase
VVAVDHVSVGHVERRKVRIGILGAGAMGRMHATAYASMPDVEIAGVFSRVGERARSVADLCNTGPVASPEVLIEDTGVDAIDVCLPTAMHHAAVISALERGKHVFCETPMALRLDEAQAMAAAARRAGRLLQVGLLMRSVAAYRHVKEVTSSGAQGRLLSLSTWRLGSYLRRGAPDHYGDPTTELMTFDFDFAQWLMGRPARVAAAGSGEVAALLSYSDGRHATISASGLMPPGFPFTVGFRALFEGACFELQTVFEKGPPRSVFTVSDGTAIRRPIELQDRNPYEIELQRFIDCIQDKADPALLDAERAVEALTLSLAAQRALAEGQPVAV